MRTSAIALANFAASIEVLTSRAAFRKASTPPVSNSLNILIYSLGASPPSAASGLSGFLTPPPERAPVLNACSFVISSVDLPFFLTTTAEPLIFSLLGTMLTS